MKRTLGSLFVMIGLLAMTPARAALFNLPDFTALVDKNGPAVVNISTTQKITRPSMPPGLEIPDLPEDSPFRDFFRHFYDGKPQQYDVQSLGSGLIISSDGYVLTCAHVIDHATEIIVRLTNRQEYEAKVIGADKRSDVALLKIDASNLPTLKIGSPSALKVGEWVLAIGAPFGFENSATAGIVSAKGRSLPNESYIPFIQTDVAINPGNSGGPLFNLDGEVVGINAQIYSRTGGFMGLSFAVPIDLAMNVVEQLKKDGRVSRGWLGVTIQNVTRDLAKGFKMKKPQGALVSDVLPDSPASRSNLKVGDIIVEYNGRPVVDSSDLPPLVGNTPIGERAKLKVIRDGRRRDVSVVIGQLPEEEELAKSSGGPTGKPTEDGVLGMKLAELNAAELKKRGVEHGVLVAAVGEGPALKADIRAGDIIVQLDRKPVKTIKQLRSALKKAAKGSSVPVLVRRQGGSLYLVLEIPE
jgi:serine protease Do